MNKLVFKPKTLGLLEKIRVGWETGNTHIFIALVNTPEPLYNTFHYNMVLGITQISASPEGHYAPNFEKVGSILVRLVRACVPSFVLPSVQKKIQARVLKFHIWIPRQKIAYPYFFYFPNYLPLPSYAPFKG